MSQTRDNRNNNIIDYDDDGVEVLVISDRKGSLVTVKDVAGEVTVIREWDCPDGWLEKVFPDGLVGDMVEELLSEPVGWVQWPILTSAVRDGSAARWRDRRMEARLMAGAVCPLVYSPCVLPMVGRLGSRPNTEVA